MRELIPSRDWNPPAGQLLLTCGHQGLLRRRPAPYRGGGAWVEETR